MDINYKINNLTFASIGLIVSDSNGIVDALAQKEPFSVNWPDANGIVADLSRPRYEARTIKLDCFLIAPGGAADFTNRMNLLYQELRKVGTQRLTLTPVAGKPFAFEVYQQGTISPEKKFRDGQMIGKFSITLVEPQPIKRVYLGVAGSQATVNITAPTPISVHWGPGSRVVLFGVNQSATTAFVGNAGDTFPVIIAGEMQRATINSISGLTLLWTY